ncbi:MULTISPECIES: hypothetical protein [unclassified Wolbachia]|uniref:hypothetical protein n=1 Tax=unclassified Wolbachia TaxID=2640676 RepID=UPI00223136B1|nr:hypothetical protein [Wolbachia endosymbiont (group B) of Melanostoma mellinum]
MPQKMRVSNQREYNEFLKKRGNVFHFVNQAIENWYENSPKVAGGNNTYSDKVVILIHIIVHQLCFLKIFYLCNYVTLFNHVDNKNLCVVEIKFYIKQLP